jgi:crotonobetainyl-CoA:carnitine CoA-transferase CaiB-like acyl-CoA transferase
VRETIDWLVDPGDGPLACLRVLDASQQLPGPYATALLASLGADVIKVEPPTGDAGRHFDPEMFRRANAGKRSIRLDLKSPEGAALLRKLAETAHVFVEGFRPGVMTRLGADYETLRGVNPTIVYCSISGFGQSGPLAARPTHDISLQAMAGALPDGVEIDRIGVPWVDLGTGTTAALLITAAWHGGRGGYVDMAMLDTALAWATIKPEAVAATEPTYGTFETGDGHSVIVALLEDTMWERLCSALGWDDWAGEPALASYRDRRHAAATIRSRLATAIAARSLAAVLELARTHDLPIESNDATDPLVRSQIDTRRGERGEPASWLPIPVAWQRPTDELT